MTWTYALPITTSLHATRFYCGDTDTTQQLVQDEEITYVLASQPNPVSAAAIVCDAIAAKFAREADATVGQVSESASQKASAYIALAKRLRQSLGRLAQPIFGGIDKTQKETLDLDSELVQPSFTIGQDDNPAAFDERADDPDDWTA